jgi:transcriptional regulator with GAF, ATPase, and Fis domain
MAVAFIGIHPMLDRALLEIVEEHAELHSVLAKLSSLLASPTTPLEFLQAAIPAVQAFAGSQWLGVLRGEKGLWRTIASSGTAMTVPPDLLAEALDQEVTVTHGDWLIAPLTRSTSAVEMVAMQRLTVPKQASLAALLKGWGLIWNAVRQREAERTHVARLEAILKIAGAWRQTLETEQLLQEMAEASTRLLKAERASIFLWDKKAKILVGRPALGVAGNELRIPEDTGVVGQVVMTGQPRRVDADIEQDQREVDRRVDQKLKFQTRSLLCVALRSKNGDVFGAFEMINKIGGNFSDDDLAALEELALHASIALENSRQYEQLLKTRNQLATQAASGVEIIGECSAIQNLRKTIKRVADTELAILVLGENGTGKEVVSQMLHYLSRRRNEPLIAVNCAAIAESLLESELFGHEKGAFTDAREARPGKFELAHRGTLFLDEIGDLSLGGQSKLLRVLEEKTVVRVGGSQTIHTDARVIAATNRNLADLVRAKKFREDLYFRLNVVTFELPPLQARGDDILLLAEHFLHNFSIRAQRKPPQLSAAAQRRLRSHAWPGNVRELRNLMERLAYLVPEEQIDAEDISFILSPRSAGPAPLSIDLPLADATKHFQTDYIQKHIDAARGNMSLAAEKLGLHRSNLYRKMQQLDMPIGDKEAE